MKKKKILILGATGMAGHLAFNYLLTTKKYDLTTVVFRNKLDDKSIVLDVTNKEKIEKLIKKLEPDIILNCIGVLISGSIKNPENAIYVNAYFPHFLARLAFESKAKLIHISTDCVFSGAKGNYSESDISDALDMYGKSKSLGEINNRNDLTIRTSIIGPELKVNGEGLFHWFMNQKGSIKGYTEAFWSGVTTLELAKFIDHGIDNELSGLLHLTNGNKISKFDLLNLLKKIWHRNNIDIRPSKIKSVDKTLLPSRSVNYVVPDYEIMLNELHDWMESEKNLYEIIY